MSLLDELSELKKEIRETEMQIKELTIMHGQSISGMPSGNSVSSPVEKFYEQLDKLQRKLEEQKKRMENYIGSIKDTEIRVIARLRFIGNSGYQEIGDEMFMDRTTAYRKLKNYFEKEGKQ